MSLANDNDAMDAARVAVYDKTQDGTALDKTGRALPISAHTLARLLVRILPQEISL